jgi:hypothetical protein
MSGVGSQCHSNKKSMFTAIISGFRRSVNEAFTLLGCYVAFVSSWLMFLDGLTVPSSRVMQPEENAVNSRVPLYKEWCLDPSAVPGILLGLLDPLTMVWIGCPETSVTTNQRCITSQKSEDLKYVSGYSPLVCDAVYTCQWIPKFRKKILLPSSCSK